jgi:hypothetical protein
MTELENLKIDLFALVERVSTLSTQNEGTFTFTKEQLLSYSKFLIDETIENIKTNIENDLDEDCLDEAIELELDYNRAIEVSIDIRAVRCQIRSIVDDSVDKDALENSLNEGLEHVFTSEEISKYLTKI